MTAATAKTRYALGCCLVLSLGLAASACGGSDDTTGTVDHDAGSAHFADLYQDILFKRCSDTSCHGGGGGGAGKLDMTTREHAYASLVDVTAAGPACKGSGLKRVVAGKPEDSLLYKKISGTQKCGDRMPLGGGMLDADSIARIEAWIEAGAKND